MLANPDFRRFWLSSMLTNFGAQVTMLALPICAVLLMHATPAEMGTLAALQSLPFLLLGLPTGVLLDRCRRLPVMLASDTMVALALASVPLAWWLDSLSIQWLYVVGFAMGSGYVIGGGAEQVYLTFLVGREGLIAAHAKFAATESASRLLGPGIAGALVQLLGAPFAILCNVVAYIVSIWNLRRVSVREPQPAPPQTHPLREVREGLAFIWHHPLLRTLAWTSGFWHLLFYGFTTLHVRFATRVLRMSPGVMGAAQMVGGLGVLASAMMVKRLTERYGTGATIVIGLCGSALGFALLPAIPAALVGSAAVTAAAYAAVVFWLDCGAMLFFMPYAALRQRVTPDPMLGRMVSTMRCITMAAAPLGALAAGALAERFSVRTGLACVAAGALALAVATVFGTRLRAARD
jgi:MFS family permease